MEVVNSLVGKVIDARYELQELLGEGGSGITYRAIRLTDQAHVAIKILSLRHLSDWKQLELFEREAKVLAQLDHPQIPKYLEYFHVDTPDNRAFYIVQQLAPGKPLTAWVQSGWRGTTAEVQDIASQILGILQYLHQQETPLVHRDIKPHNTVRNDEGQVFLVDFGAVQDVYNHTLIRGSTVAGTYGYMAPEQFRGQAVPASDLYGLGATMLYLLTHRSPAELPQERLKISFRKHVNLPDYLANWLDMMLEPDVADRFPSATKAADALRQQHRFRIQKGIKVGFPWRGAAAALAAMCLTLPLVHQYRYVFLTLVGLQPRDLCSSIERNDLTVVNDYLSHGGNPNVSVNVRKNILTDVNSFDSNTTTGSLLHCAISAGKPKIVQYLLQRGVNAQMVDEQGVPPLNRAIYEYNRHDYKCAERKPDCSPMYQVIELLAKTPGLDINIRSDQYSSKDIRRESALFLAVRLKNQLAVKQLLSLGANTDTQNYQKSNLWHALAQGNTITTHEEPNENGTEFAVQIIANMLFVKNQDINHQNDQGNSPLHLAVMSGNNTMVNFLLSKKANINRKKNGYTPLMEAVLKGNLEVTKQLLAAGASANEANNDGNTALHLNFLTGGGGTISDSQFKKQTEIMSALLQKGANPNLENAEGNSAIHSLADVNTTISSGMCIHRNRDATKLLDVLVSKESNRQMVNKQGETALHRFATHNDLRLMKSAVSYNWQLSSKSNYSLTPLEVAANHHKIEIDKMQRILDPKFQVNQRDDQGNTMLHQAVSAGDSDLVKVLMNLGANTQAANSQDQTPLSLARLLASRSKTEKNTSTHGFINQCQIENFK